MLSVLYVYSVHSSHFIFIFHIPGVQLPFSPMKLSKYSQFILLPLNMILCLNGITFLIQDNISHICTNYFCILFAITQTRTHSGTHIKSDSQLSPIVVKSCAIVQLTAIAFIQIGRDANFRGFIQCDKSLAYVINLNESVFICVRFACIFP